LRKPLLKMNKISKVFPGIKALDNVDFELFPGEVHALMGENGAGKSTLMKVLSGVYQQSTGEIFIDNKKVEINSPSVAQELGISIIHQEFNLFPNLSAAENIFLDRSDMKTKIGKIDWKKIYKEADEIIKSIGSDIDVRKEVQHLSVHSHQVIEIAKSLSFNAKILIMDEPSAALSEAEVQKMFKVIKRLKNNGVAIVYVSHRMKEIMQIADKVTVLRDGKKVSTKLITETSEDQIISDMIGQEISDLYPTRTKLDNNETILSLKEFYLNENSKVTLELKKGEILGLFGLVGSGIQTLAERIFGLKKGKGFPVIKGSEIKINSPQDAMDNGIAYLPSDRHNQGIVKELTVRENITLPILSKLSKKMMIQGNKELDTTDTYIKQLNIRPSNPEQIVNLLSGGNQQKVVLAKWLATNPTILILEEPTRGVDVGAKSEIYHLIDELSKEGISIIFISTEMPELIGMSDRILVMNNGTIVKEFERGEADQHKLLKEASNLKGKAV